MNLGKIKIEVMLFGLFKALQMNARRNPEVRRHLQDVSLVAQIGLMDRSQGRCFIFADGKVASQRGFHPAPDVSTLFKDAETAVALMTPPTDHAATVHAAKNFKVLATGPDDRLAWFMKLVAMVTRAGWSFGTPMPDGSRRFTTMTNGGPLFV